MIFALLFIGLLPIMFLPDVFDNGGDEDVGNGLAEGEDPELDPTDDGFGDILSPVEDDATPPDEPILVDDDDVLGPDEDDANPDDYGAPIGDGGLIDPNETPDEEYQIDGDGTLLQQLLDEQSADTTGIGFLGTQIGDTSDFELGAQDDSLTLPEDDIDGNGEGALGSWDGTALIQTEGDLNVVSGGAGDDTISAGDEAAYIFGGAGDDTLAAGDGAAAIYGGAGNDTITGSDAVRADGTAAAYLDGGEGDDTIIGGDANEVISGGEHGEGEASGDDTLSGGGGDDAIRGGRGVDILSGGDGDDVIDHYGNSEELVRAEQNEFSWHIDNDADILDGGEGNDTLIFDRADSATGGEGNDTFWLYFDSASGVGFAEITDFSSGEDFLRVSLNPDITSGTPEVSVTPSEDGLDGVVRVNGEVVAMLRGAPDATAGDIYVDVPENIFG